MSTSQKSALLWTRWSGSLLRWAITFQRQPGRANAGEAFSMTEQEQPPARVLVADRIAREGLDYLRQEQLQVDERVGLTPEQLIAMLGDYTALVVRSETKVTAPII